MLRDHRPGLIAEPSATRPFLETLRAWRELPAEVQDRRIGQSDESLNFQPSEEPERGRVRVGLWCPCLGLGEAEVWQLSLAKAVDPSRIVWKGAAVIDEANPVDPAMHRKLGERMPVGKGFADARTIAGVSDVVVTWAVTDVEAILKGLENPPRVVMACHFPGESPWGPGTEKLLDSVARFVAVSELAVDSTPISVRDRLGVIWNAVDPDRLRIRCDRDAIRSLWGIPIDARVAGYVGRLAPEKDPDAMLRLVDELPEPWHVAIVGEGRERDRLSTKIDEQGLTRAHLVGGDASAGDVLNAFDALVVPSRYESFGLTLAEGLWLGLPVIATPSGLARLVPGLVREVAVGASGLELAEALLADTFEVQATRQRVDRARNFARKRLTLERFGREWTDLLLQVAGAGKGRVTS